MADNTATSLNATIDLDNSNFIDGLSKSMQAVVSFNNKLGQIQQHTDTFGELSDGLTDLTDNLSNTTNSFIKFKTGLADFNTDNIEEVSEELGDVFTGLKESTNSFVEFNNQINDLRGKDQQFIKINDAIDESTIELIDLNKGLTDTATSIIDIGKQAIDIKNTEKSFEGVSKVIQNTTLQTTKLLGGLSKATTSIINIDSQIRKFRKNEDVFENLGDEVDFFGDEVEDTIGPLQDMGEEIEDASKETNNFVGVLAAAGAGVKTLGNAITENDGGDTFAEGMGRATVIGYTFRKMLRSVLVMFPQIAIVVGTIVGIWKTWGFAIRSINLYIRENIQAQNELNNLTSGVKAYATAWRDVSLAFGKFLFPMKKFFAEARNLFLTDLLMDLGFEENIKAAKELIALQNKLNSSYNTTILATQKLKFLGETNLSIAMDSDERLDKRYEALSKYKKAQKEIIDLNLQLAKDDLKLFEGIADPEGVNADKIFQLKLEIEELTYSLTRLDRKVKTVKKTIDDALYKNPPARGLINIINKEIEDLRVLEKSTFNPKKIIEYNKQIQDLIDKIKYLREGKPEIVYNIKFEKTDDFEGIDDIDIDESDTKLPIVIPQLGSIDHMRQMLSMWKDLRDASVVGSNAFDVYGKSIENWSKKLEDALSNTKKLKEETSKLGSALTDLAAQGISAASKAIGEMIGGGTEDALENFILGIANLLQGFGALLVGFGTSLLILQTSMNPYAMIAAGVALIIIGAAMSAKMGSISDAAGGTASTGSAGGSSGYDWNREIALDAGGSGGSGGVFGDFGYKTIQVEGKLYGEGSDLVAVINKTNNKKSGIGGI